ncbi:MAG: nuclear transport factor 2 family protein [Terriglobales bacterium]
MDDKVVQELIDVSNEWDRVMVENDPEAIGRYMADDWIIIGSDGNACDKATFLGLVKSGVLSHDVMESHDLNIRVYGDTAVVTARGVSGGKYQGQPFREVERVSCIFVRQKGQWRCVLTHLSRMAPANTG